MPVYYPVFLDIEGKKCVVVGGGEVAERKVNALLECGASAIVISLHISERLRRLAEEGVIQVSLRDYQYGDLEGARIAIAATCLASPSIRSISRVLLFFLTSSQISSTSSHKIAKPSWADANGLLPFEALSNSSKTSCIISRTFS